MLDMGFDKDIQTLQRYMPTAQTMIFSATIPSYIQDIATKKLKNPLLIDLVGTQSDQIPDTIKNICVVTGDREQKQMMIKDYILKNKGKKMIVFCETKKDCTDFGNQTYFDFLPLHGDMNQAQRQQNIAKFRREDNRSILVATDVAARGLDINDIDVVLQYECRHVDSFVHRTGRTGRAGKEGTNIVFSAKNNLSFISEIEKGLKTTIEYRNVLVEDKTDEAEVLNKAHAHFIKKVSKPVKHTKAVEMGVEQAMSHYNELDNEGQQLLMQHLLSDYYKRNLD
jgi:ATP-dependent RNA helicase DDX21